MKAWALLRYDLEGSEFNFPGAYQSTEAAMSAAEWFNGKGRMPEGVPMEWDDEDPGRLSPVVCDLRAHGEAATWYVSAVEVVPEPTWRAALEAARYLRAILWGIARNGAGR